MGEWSGRRWQVFCVAIPALLMEVVKDLFATSTVSTERRKILSGCFAKLVSGVSFLVDFEVKVNFFL